MGKTGPSRTENVNVVTQKSATLGGNMTKIMKTNNMRHISASQTISQSFSEWQLSKINSTFPGHWIWEVIKKVAEQEESDSSHLWLMSRHAWTMSSWRNDDSAWTTCWTIMSRVQNRAAAYNHFHNWFICWLMSQKCLSQFPRAQRDVYRLLVYLCRCPVRWPSSRHLRLSSRK